MEVVIISFYLIVLIYSYYRILMDTLSTTKTLAYLLVVALFPVLGIIFYYSFRIINRGLKKGQWLIAPTSYSAKKYA